MISLYPEQEQVLDKLAQTKSSLIIAETGSGKTIMALKKIIPTTVVDIINAKDDMSGSDESSYTRLLTWIHRWGTNKRLAVKETQVDAVSEESNIDK